MLFLVQHNNIHLIITLFIGWMFILEYLFVLILNCTFMNIDLIIKERKTVILRSLYFFFILVIIIGIFVWRLQNFSRVIELPENLLYLLHNTFNSIVKNLELNIIHLILIGLLLITCTFLFLSLLITCILYIKSRAYSAHVYFLTYRKYSKLVYFLLVNPCIKVNIFFSKFVSRNYSNRHMPIRIISKIIYYKKYWLEYLNTRIIYWLPLYLLFYDVYLFDKISKFYFWLPWIYLLIIFRMCKKFANSTFVYTNGKSDVELSALLYKSCSYQIYCVNCRIFSVTETNEFSIHKTTNSRKTHSFPLISLIRIKKSTFFLLIAGFCIIIVFVPLMLLS